MGLQEEEVSQRRRVPQRFAERKIDEKRRLNLFCLPDFFAVFLG
jgi:hypothetical protein